MKKYLLLVIFSVVLLFSSCSTQKSAEVKEKPAIEESRATIGGYEALIIKNNINRIICIYILELDKTYYINF
jgi:hypothetical protein